jgi:hypothetical protein
LFSSLLIFLSLLPNVNNLFYLELLQLVLISADLSRNAPDSVFAGLANPKARYRISSRISGRILALAAIFFVKYRINVFKKTALTIIGFCKH